MTLKEKIAMAKQKDYLLNEIANYQSALDGTGTSAQRFANYYKQRIAVLRNQLIELTGE